MRLDRLLGIVLLLALAAPAGAAEPSPALPGWTGHLYADQNFATYATPVKMPSWTLRIDVGKFDWPAGPPAGWSLAVYGQLQVNQPGAYVFKHDGSRTELWLGALHVPLDGQTPVDLPAGPAPVRLYAKCDAAQPRNDVDVAVQ